MGFRNNMRDEKQVNIRIIDKTSDFYYAKTGQYTNERIIEDVSCIIFDGRDAIIKDYKHDGICHARCFDKIEIYTVDRKEV